MNMDTWMMDNTSLHRIARAFGRIGQAFWSGVFVLFAWLIYRGRFDGRDDHER